MTAIESFVQGIAPHTDAAGNVVSFEQLAAAVRKAEELGLVPRRSWRDYDEESVNRIKAVVQAAMEAA